MSPAEWKRIQSITESVLHLPWEQRPSAAREACGDDAQLFAQVERILANYSESDDLGGLTTDTLPAPDRTGQRAGNYLLVRLIGEGGMGSVYLAERADQTFSKTVAVKITHPESGGAGHLFLREREILARLEHAHIARLLDAGTLTDGSLFFVMEYVDGAHPLTTFARDLPLKQRLRLFLQACAAVQYAHQQGVIHCDLKPGNILVNATGEVKVVDFGIAQPAGAVAPGQVSSGYASPEQRTTGRATALSDIHALGVTLRQLAGSGGAELTAIVRRASADDPALRYESVAMLAADVRNLLEGRGVQAYSTDAFYGARKWIARHPAQTVAFVVVLALAVAGMVAAVRQQEGVKARTLMMRELARKILLEDLPALEGVPNSTALRANLMSEMGRTLTMLESEADGDPDLQIELARAYHQTGRLKAGSTAGSLANYAAALQDLERSAKLYRMAVQSRPDNLDIRAVMLRVELEISYRLTERGQFADASAAASNVERQILALPPHWRESPVLRRQLSTTYHALGNIAIDTGGLRDALEYRRKSLAVYAPELTAAKLPDGWLRNPTFRDHVANLFAASASTGSIVMGYAPEFEAAARRSLAILHACLPAPICQVRTAETSIVLADLLFSAGRVAGAEAVLHDALDLAIAISRNDQGDQVALSIQSDACFALARCTLARRSGREALTFVARARELDELRMKADPTNPRNAESATTLVLLEGMAHFASGQRDAARRIWEAGLGQIPANALSLPQVKEVEFSLLRELNRQEQARQVARDLASVGAERAAVICVAAGEAEGGCRTDLAPRYPVVRGGVWIAPKLGQH